jgi:hypothetical protein
MQIADQTCLLKQVVESRRDSNRNKIVSLNKTQEGFSNGSRGDKRTVYWKQ